MGGIRVVDRSTFTFASDLPPASQHIHPSGILHAVRLTPSNIGRQTREEHAFAWIANCVHVDSAAAHLETNGFDRDDVAFLPYSSKWNWLDRYPHAEPALECDESGKVTVYLNYRPYPNGLGEVHRDRAREEAAAAKGAGKEAEAAATAPPKRRGPKKKFNPDAERLTELERDELHAEAYDYFHKLKERLEELEKKCRAERSQNSTKKTTHDSDEEEAESEPEPEAGEPKKKRRRTRKRYLHPALKGTKPSEIEGVLKGMEAAFAIIPGVAAELARRKEEEKERGEREKDDDDDEEGAADGKKAIEKATEKAHDVPFLERALKPAMKELVAARTVARASEGKPKRRSRVAPTKPRNFRDFDDMFERLVRYKEEHGDTLVPISYEDKQLALFVSNMRERKAQNAQKGIEYEEPDPRRLATPRYSSRILTAERIERLESIGFVWFAGRTRPVSWEERFRAMMRYYEENGSWPPQSLGSLGIFVHRQRKKYLEKNQKFMETHFHRLDEVGFEWTPRGNTRMSWDEGFELLMQFGRVHGHFDVPRPAPENGGKSDAQRLYNWVTSLHAMYRSYKLGRKSGSLTEERVDLLIKRGVFTAIHEGPLAG